jgi:hypothetical protein
MTNKRELACVLKQAPPPNTPSQQAAPGTATRPRAGTAPWRLCTPAGEGALTSRLTAVLRAAADGLPAGEAAQLTITRSDRVRWAAAVPYATAWAASSTGLL